MSSAEGCCDFSWRMKIKGRGVLFLTDRVHGPSFPSPLLQRQKFPPLPHWQSCQCLWGHTSPRAASPPQQQADGQCWQWGRHIHPPPRTPSSCWQLPPQLLGLLSCVCLHCCGRIPSWWLSPRCFVPADPVVKHSWALCDKGLPLIHLKSAAG